MELALSPHGKVYLLAQDGQAAVPAAAASAFEQGSGHGVLFLGSALVDASLPPAAAYFRDFGRAFVTRLCGVPDLETVRERVEVPAPAAELPALCESAPPMIGAEYLTPDVLGALWSDMEAALRDELRAFAGSVEEYLHARNPAWNLVGRVCFHLAENKGDDERPFAFLATYTTRLSRQARPQHVPLGQAVRDFSAARDKQALLKLLAPVQRAAEKSALARQLVESGDIYHPLPWTPAEAHRFLKEVAVLEAAGIVVRVPDWWKARRRPQVAVRIGGDAPAGLGADALLDFDVSLTLGGERISEKEWRELAARTEGLVRLRGQWVEIDRDRLAEVLAHWKAIERSAEGGVSFLEGMRLLAGASLGGDEEPQAAQDREWLSVEAGAWLGKVLESLRSPESLAALDPGAELKTALRPYQKVGLSWLWLLCSLGLGACLADDMGLGKTVQVLALLLALRKRKETGTHLLVVPASLIANWQSEIERFAPSLRVLVAHPSVTSPADLDRVDAAALAKHDLVVTTYGYVYRQAWIAQAQWDLVVLDEAQAVKNPSARQTRAVKELRARRRIALTGTPVENRLSDLWSLFDFLNPGLLGSAKQFGQMAKRMAARQHEPYAPLRRLVRPYILRRLKSDRRIIADLPDKTEVKAFCTLTKAQAALYQQSVEALRAQLEAADGMRRRGVILAFLTRFKQICNHPSQWLGDGEYADEASGKIVRLREICDAIAARQEKVLVFTQFRELVQPLAGALERVFGRPGLVLSGQTAVRERKERVERFQSDERVPFFVLSVKAGGTGLNLTAASHVVHFDRWWNPAVENQATDRAYRIGQKRNVVVHKFICRGTVEEKIDAMIESKQHLSAELIEGGGEVLLTELSNREIMDLVTLDVRRAMEDD